MTLPLASIQVIPATLPGAIGNWLAGAIGWIEHYLSPIILILLLGVELYVLWLISQERRERKDHIRSIHDHTKVLSRKVYESVIDDEVRRAKRLIYCYWHSLHAEEDSKRYRSINQQLIEAHKNMDVKLMIARDPSRIAAAYELAQAGVTVVFQKALLISDLRFSLFDEKLSVVGMSESEINSDKPSRHGVGITNRKLNAMLLQYFNAELESASTFKEFLGSVVTTKVLEDPTNTHEMIAEQLGVPVPEIEACCAGAEPGSDSAE